MVARAAQQVIDDGAGFLVRRARARKAAGIVAIGKTELRPEPPKAEPADRIRRHRREASADAEWQKTIEGELRAVDGRLAEIEKRLVQLGAFGPTYEAQELAGERRMLRELRREIEADMPITTNRDGRSLTDRDRAILRARTRELSELAWRGGEQAAGEGDHRRARQCRHDSLRARQIAEHEMHWRGSLRGYSY